jgi:hypothetical protein
MFTRLMSTSTPTKSAALSRDDQMSTTLPPVLGVGFACRSVQWEHDHAAAGSGIKWERLMDIKKARNKCRRPESYEKVCRQDSAKSFT